MAEMIAPRTIAALTVPGTERVQARDARHCFLPQKAVRGRRNCPPSEEWSLATGNALVDQNFDLNPTVLSPPGLSLVRCRWSVFAHCPRCHDMPDRHATLLNQIGDHRLRAVLAQLCVHGSAARRVSIACHFDDISSKASRSSRQFFEFFLVSGGNLGATGSEFHGCLSLYVIFGQSSKSFCVLLDIFYVFITL